MSTFIHGGSALVLDIAGKAHAALRAGDVVQIDPMVASLEDGYTTRVPDFSNADGQLAPYGVVLGSPRKDRFALGEDILIRILGVVDVNFSNTNVAGRSCQVQDGVMTVADTGGVAFLADATNTRVCGISHTAGSGAHQSTVFFNGLTTWG